MIPAEEIDRLHHLDPVARAKATVSSMDGHRQAILTLADIRAGAVRQLLDAGITQAEIARRLGVTPPAVAKMVRRQ